ncbi:MAG: TIGR00296 family protein, partial [Candidatus Woesearchaeota archaeon]|nr:TIGR00296 family protein [Candidatus Woesearchaeota archaeon]
NKIIIGRDGLIIRSPFGSGLLLPQVPVEWGWDAEQFLEHLCEKAGLDTDAWKRNDVKIYSFQAQIFSEKGPRGEVIEKEL